MTEPVDFYADLASLNVSPNGMTLIFLRSMPVPVGAIDDSGALRLDEEHPQTGGRTASAALNFEIVARVRVTPPFAAALRDLLSRTLDELVAADTSSGNVSADLMTHDPVSE